MSFNDWVTESKQRFETKPATTATRQSARAFVNGAFRRAGQHIGRPIWDRRDWDVLIVMDACRTDLWDEVAPEYGLPESNGVWSNASCSIDWIQRNFTQYPDRVRDVGYITSNPFADHSAESCRSANLSDVPVGHFDPLYRTHWAELYDGQIATVPPEVMTDHAIDAWRRRDELGINQLVVHYMQPHEPYRSRPEWGSGDHKLLENLIDPDEEAGASIWPALQEGEVDMDEFWDVYKDNLRWVLDDVTDRLLENVDGEVVLTSDHGNALGEWGEWHHPPGAIGPAVRKVPWATVEGRDSRTVNPDVTAAETDTDTNTKEQLEALGYR